jgi:regulator of RNase E activity RraA
VVSIPRALAEQVIEAAFEQDQREEFLLSKILQGSSILGVHPPDERTLGEYQDWQRRPDSD